MTLSRFALFTSNWLVRLTCPIGFFSSPWMDHALLRRMRWRPSSSTTMTSQRYASQVGTCRCVEVRRAQWSSANLSSTSLSQSLSANVFWAVKNRSAGCVGCKSPKVSFRVAYCHGNVPFPCTKSIKESPNKTQSNESESDLGRTSPRCAEIPGNPAPLKHPLAHHHSLEPRDLRNLDKAPLVPPMWATIDPAVCSVQYHQQHMAEWGSWGNGADPPSCGYESVLVAWRPT